MRRAQGGAAEGSDAPQAQGSPDGVTGQHGSRRKKGAQEAGVFCGRAPPGLPRLTRCCTSGRPRENLHRGKCQVCTDIVCFQSWYMELLLLYLNTKNKALGICFPRVSLSHHPEALPPSFTLFTADVRVSFCSNMCGAHKGQLPFTCPQYSQVYKKDHASLFITSGLGGNTY